MAQILAMAGSNSSTSINFELVRQTVGELSEHDVQLVELAKEQFPMYGEDLEKASGIPPGILNLYDRLQAADGLVLSVNEHNGNPSAFTKNILDWLSRKDRTFLDNLPVLLMSASRGRRGAQSSRERVGRMLSQFGARITSEFSLPSFSHTFAAGQGITDEALREQHHAAIKPFLDALEG